MEMPEVWMVFGSLIHQDFMTDYPDFYSGIVQILSGFSTDQKIELLMFLKQLTDPTVPSQLRLEIWLQSGAQFFLVEEPDLSNMLIGIREIVESQVQGDT